MIKESETMRACVHSVDVLVSVVKRHAIVDVQRVLVIRVVMVFTFHLYYLLFHFTFQFSLLYNSSNSFPVANLQICFHYILTAFLGVVFTLLLQQSHVFLIFVV